jgi:putative tricarboxylic transport membrane protein
VAQLLLLETVGWVLATTLLFVAVARAFGSRRLAVDAAIGVVLASLAFAVFNYGLGLSLPTGTLVESLLPADEESE